MSIFIAALLMSSIQIESAKNAALLATGSSNKAPISISSNGFFFKDRNDNRTATIEDDANVDERYVHPELIRNDGYVYEKEMGDIDWIEHRSDTFKFIEQMLKPINEMARGDVEIDFEVIFNNAQAIRDMSGVLKVAYENEVKGGRTKDEAWTQMNDFRKGLSLMESNGAKLMDTATANDRRALREDTRTLIQTCRTCHQAYRTR